VAATNDARESCRSLLGEVVQQREIRAVAVDLKSVPLLVLPPALVMPKRGPIFSSEPSGLTPSPLAAFKARTTLNELPLRPS